MEANFFAQQYQYFLNKIKWLSLFGNNSITYQLAAWLATKYSPFRFQIPQIIQNLSDTLQLSEKHIKNTSLNYVKQHGIFCINALFFEKMTLEWVKNHVFIKNPATLEKLLNNSNGGLFLSYHHHFQHLLVSLLGIYKKNPSFVAMSPESSPFYNILKSNIDYLHQHTEHHFGKGKYIFIYPQQSRKIVREEIYQTLEERGLIFSLHDNLVSPSQNTQSLQFFNKIMTVSAGTIKIALEMNKPIYCGLLEWKESNKFEFDLVELNSNHGVLGILKEYFEFLEQKIKQNPSIWEGWQWFQDCTLFEGTQNNEN